MPRLSSVDHTARGLALVSVTVAANMVHASPLDLAHQAMHQRGDTVVGCYSNSSAFFSNDATKYWKYQSSLWCTQNNCDAHQSGVMGLSGGGYCWCGTELPPTDTKVDDSNCNIPCFGYGSDVCGGNGYVTVLLTGLQNNVPTAGEDGSSSSSSSSGSSSSTPSSSADSSSSPTPTVITSQEPGQTILVTVAPSSSATTVGQSANSGSGSGGTNTVGIAVGVVVGIVGFAAIVAGVYFYLRHRRRERAEEDYKRHQITDFFAPTRERKPPSSSYSHMSDSRLEPEGARRNSVGSLADSQDYSRRILRVANPDSS